ncbi:MAG: AAA family ATPase [bacterium]
MAIIAISIEPGSLSANFASGLATSLGIELVDQRNIEWRIAEHSDAGDCKCRRFVKGWPLSFHRRKIASRQLWRKVTVQTLDIAARGNVLIVSWVAPIVLRHVRPVLKVCIRAPVVLRKSNERQQFASDREPTVKCEIECKEALLVRFVRGVFDTDWRDADLYDLILNTERVANTNCVQLVMHLAHSPQYQETSNSRADLAAQLRCLQASNLELSCGEPIRSVVAMAGAESVSLEGIDSSEGAIAMIEQDLRGSLEGKKCRPFKADICSADCRAARYCGPLTPTD